MPKLRWASVLLLIFVPCLAAPTCGGRGADKLAGEPCTRTSECQRGLDCVGGVCIAPRRDAGPDGGADSGAPDGAVPDAS
jgi:hypothetical protein